jgi:aspartyl protease family protein
MAPTGRAPYIASMTIPTLADFMTSQPVLALALAAMLVTVLGGVIRRSLPLSGRLLRGFGNLGLIAALVLTIAQVARINPDVDLALPQLGMPEQRVEGGETLVPLARDGHFWVEAKVNGVPQRFLVDTGASVTAMGTQNAAEAEIEPQPFRQSIILRTAGGSAPARLGSIGELRFGSIVARDLDTVIAPGLGGVNVLGMNFLSKLHSWRVEGKTMILVPNHPQPAAN